MTELEYKALAAQGYNRIPLIAESFAERNYTTEKNRRNDPGRMELKKYCSRCRKHTPHRETK